MKLSLERFALIAEIVGGFAVIVSVIYLSFQVNQNTSAMRSLTHLQMFDTTTSVNQSISNDPQLASLLVKAANDVSSLSESERIQLTYLYTNYFNMWLVGFENYHSGFLDKKAWTVWDSGMTTLITDQIGSRFTWDSIGHWYAKDFRDHVENVIKIAGPITHATGNMRGIK
jgi:hypothetical protein